jgi:hypothetical protein
MTRSKEDGVLGEDLYFGFLVIGGPLGLAWTWLVIFPSVLGSVLEAWPHVAFSVYWAFCFFWNWRKTCTIGPGHPPLLVVGGRRGGREDVARDDDDDGCFGGPCGDVGVGTPAVTTLGCLRGESSNERESTCAFAIDYRCEDLRVLVFA